MREQKGLDNLVEVMKKGLRDLNLPGSDSMIGQKCCFLVREING